MTDEERKALHHEMLVKFGTQLELELADLITLYDELCSVDAFSDVEEVAFGMLAVLEIVTRVMLIESASDQVLSLVYCSALAVMRNQPDSLRDVNLVELGTLA